MSQYETRALDELVPYDMNPRINDKAVDKVLQSIKENGYVSPIVVSEIGHPFGNHVICAGHTRYEALKRFGSKEVEVIIHKFDSEEQFVRYNLADNKTGEFAEWDEAILGQLSSQFDIDLMEMDFEFSEDKIDMVNSSDENDEWVGMPEFEEKEDSLKIIIHFESDEDREEFSRKYPFEIMKKQKNAWSTQFPYNGPDDLDSVRFSSDEQ